MPPLRDPVMVAAFEGWNDAGEAASGAVAHLEEVWGARQFAELDPEEYHDFQVARPLVSIEDGVRTITWPATRLYWASPPGAKRDVVLVRGWSRRCAGAATPPSCSGTPRNWGSLSS